MGSKIKYIDKNCDTFGEVHYVGPISDYTLCGLTLDSDPKTAGRYKNTNRKLTCTQCEKIINYCHTIRKPL